MAAKFSEEEIANIEDIVDYHFKDRDLLIQAFTHSSSVPNMSAEKNVQTYERLEFLGDRILGLLISTILYERFPQANEGELSRRFNSLINSDICARLAQSSGISKFIRLSAELRKAKINRNITADVMEAFIAALYLDGGIEVAKRFVDHVWKDEFDKDIEETVDAKTALQEWAHKQHKSSPSYNIIKSEGPAHEPIFSVEVRVHGLQPEIGVGRSKRKAQANAARNMLYREGIWHGE